MPAACTTPHAAESFGLSGLVAASWLNPEPILCLIQVTLLFAILLYFSCLLLFFQELLRL